MTRGAGQSVLIVDDDRSTRNGYAEFLELYGFTTVTAATGGEAFEIAKVAAPALILMDATMPGIDGWTATRLLKLDTATRRIPVILLTGHTSPQDRDRARTCAADGFIAKPCALEDLLRQVQKVLGESRPPPVGDL